MTTKNVKKITLADIARELKVSPKEARRKARAGQFADAGMKKAPYEFVAAKKRLVVAILTGKAHAA